jgi:hypothetical protein
MFRCYNVTRNNVLTHINVHSEPAQYINTYIKVRENKPRLVINTKTTHHYSEKSIYVAFRH